MDIKKWVKSIQNAGYNGAHTVYDGVFLKELCMLDVICECPLIYTLEYDAYFSENLRRATTRHIENGVKYYKNLQKVLLRRRS